MTANPLRQRYPWLFLDEPHSIDIIYDAEEPDDNDRESPVVQDTVATALAINQALKSLGHSTRLSPLTHQNYQQELPKLKGDIVFNQVEEDELGFSVLTLLEKLQKPVTGVDSAGFALSWEKEKIKSLLLSAHIPTPRYFTVQPGQTPDPQGLPFPLFVKAADDHGSLSINENSLVENLEQLTRQINWIRKTIGGVALVEEYIDGRELGVTSLGNGDKLLILPIKETVFGQEFAHKPKIVTYEGKWAASSSDYKATSSSCPAQLTATEGEAIKKAVKDSCKTLGVRDYARFDVRLKDSIPYIIDYNANPSLGPHTEASILPAKVFGLSYAEFIAATISVALKRYQ